MHGFWLLVHLLGFALWIGGGLATMVEGVAAKGYSPADRLKAYKLVGVVQRLLVGPGAAAVVFSGVIMLLSGPYMHSGEMPGWLNGMMGAGILGGLVAVIVSVPTATRLSHLELQGGELPPAFAALRKRQMISATIAGSLALIALFAATLGR
ncbi:MAG TPA: hypothetical protein VN848_09950 [Gemmatimonadales bacterium]|nr:hypothetical protein [Gemmatimonadales bacterium]